jgi:hypothetical protein
LPIGTTALWLNFLLCFHCVPFIFNAKAGMWSDCGFLIGKGYQGSLNTMECYQMLLRD